MNLYVMYYDGTAVRSTVTVARAGAFEVEGASKRPAIVEFLDNEYRVLGRIVASNGDKVECMLSRTKSLQDKGHGQQGAGRMVRLFLCQRRRAQSRRQGGQ